jgi:hypothetical protein
MQGKVFWCGLQSCSRIFDLIVADESKVLLPPEKAFREPCPERAPTPARVDLCVGGRLAILSGAKCHRFVKRDKGRTKKQGEYACEGVCGQGNPKRKAHQTDDRRRSKC